MSQYIRQLANGRDVRYGFDAPTGGYFLTVFYREDEIVDDESVSFVIDGITLTEEVRWLEDFGIDFDLTVLAKDGFNYDPPTRLQVEVCKAAGWDIVELLYLVKEDLDNHWEEYRD